MTNETRLLIGSLFSAVLIWAGHYYHRRPDKIHAIGRYVYGVLTIIGGYAIATLPEYIYPFFALLVVCGAAGAVDVIVYWRDYRRHEKIMRKVGAALKGDSARDD